VTTLLQLGVCIFHNTKFFIGCSFWEVTHQKKCSLGSALRDIPKDACEEQSWNNGWKGDKMPRRKRGLRGPCSPKRHACTSERNRYTVMYCWSVVDLQFLLNRHFRVHLSLHFKARLIAKSLLWKSVFIHIEIGTNYHNKNVALRLALKKRLKGTRKWPVSRPYRSKLLHRDSGSSAIEVSQAKWHTRRW